MLTGKIITHNVIRAINNAGVNTLETINLGCLENTKLNSTDDYVLSVP